MQRRDALMRRLESRFDDLARGLDEVEQRLRAGGFDSPDSATGGPNKPR